VYGSDRVAAFARDAFALLTKKGVVPQDIMKSVMQVGAWYGGDEAFRWFVQRLRSTESEHERMNILAALGSFRDPSLIKKVQRYILEQVPDRNKFIPISYLATNPYAIPYMWAWFESNVTLLERFHPIHFERVIAAIVPVCGLGREERVKTFFESYAARGGKAGDAIRLSLERLEIHSRMRRS
jgi:aminopeptidase N